MKKHAAILNAAKRLFAQDSFADVSMDRIAAEAGVSKLTIYSHFGDKETLFAAAVSAQCQEMLPDNLFHIRQQGTLREQLKMIACAFFSMICAEQTVNVHRIMLGHGNIDMTLKHIFWKAGAERTHRIFTKFLQAWIDTGALDIADVDCASKQFFTLIKGELHMRIICGLCNDPSPEEVEAHLDAAVDFFLRAYTPRMPAVTAADAPR
jgi:TetR/AcrR family transcriptional repressor of mexJK operon